MTCVGQCGAVGVRVKNLQLRQSGCSYVPVNKALKPKKQVRFPCNFCFDVPSVANLCYKP